MPHPPRLPRRPPTPNPAHGDVRGGKLEVDAAKLARRGGEPVAGGAGAADVNREPQRVPAGDAGAPCEAFIEDVEPRDLPDLLARALERRDRFAEQLLAVDRGLPSRGGKRAGGKPA